MTFTKSVSVAALAAFAFAPAAVHAAGDAFADNGLILAAEEAGVCGDAAVVSATLTDQNTISAVCADDSALGAVPLIGSLSPAAAAAAAGAAVLAVVLIASNDDDGDAASDTQ